MSYQAKKFSIPELTGISQTNIEEHIKLYEGYVANTNKILEAIKNKDEFDSYALSEMRRRFAFEFDGMRNHEIYFASLEHGATEIHEESEFKKAITKEWGSFEAWLEDIKGLAKTRGVGWAMLYFDTQEKKLLNTWVDEQHLGHLTGCTPILALDVWEHAFVADYQPSGKGQYIDDFFVNINWDAIAKNFSEALSS
jgi:Fe-Mn family superoxide dismutase